MSENDNEKDFRETVKAGMAKGEEATDSVLRRLMGWLIKSNWTLAICAIALLFLLWLIVK